MCSCLFMFTFVMFNHISFTCCNIVTKSMSCEARRSPVEIYEGTHGAAIAQPRLPYGVNKSSPFCRITRIKYVKQFECLKCPIYAFISIVHTSKKHKSRTFPVAIFNAYPP